MASNETKDILKAKQLVNEARKSGKTMSTRAITKYPAPRGGPGGKGGKNLGSNPWAKEQTQSAKSIEAKAKAIKNAKIAAAKAKEAARVNTAKANAKNKIKAQGAKINSSATSGYNRRGKK
jgi:hypothetical protein